MNHDSNRSILRAAGEFFGGTLLSRVTGLVRDITMAFAFGTHPSTAAFFMAFRFAHLLRRLLGEGAMQTAFIPQFEELRKKDSHRAACFFRDLSCVLVLLLSAIILVSGLSLGTILIFANLSRGNHEVFLLTLLMIPSLLFICLYGLNASLLQCEKKFFLSGVAPVAFNLSWIVGVLMIWFANPEHPMIWLSLMIVISCLLQWGITLPETIKILRNNGINSFYQKISWFSADLSLMGKPLLLGLIGIGAAQINNALDVIFARYADSEGPALLWYAFRIQQVPLALFGIALSKAMLPPLSRALNSGKTSQYHSLFIFSLRQCFWIMIPATLCLFLLGETGIRWVYERGNFTESSVMGTTYCLYAYGLGLLPMSLVLVLAPAFYSQGNYGTPTRASVFSMITNLVLNAIFILNLKWGPSSVALATSLSAWINLGILGVSFMKTTKILEKNVELT